MAAVAVYKITNTVNGKLYFGQSSRPTDRWAEHKRTKKAPKLRAAMVKHGAENFDFIILCWCPDKSYADYVEQELIKAYDTRQVGYNICVGGEGLIAGPNNPNYGRKQSVEHRAKIQKAREGFTLSDEAKTKISLSLKGRKIPPDVVAKQVAARKGRKLSEESKQKISAANKGKTRSAEYRAKMAEVKRGQGVGRTLTAETREKISKARKGMQFSEETRRKLSEAAKAQHLKRKQTLSEV